MAKVLHLRSEKRLKDAKETTMRDFLTGLHNRRYFYTEMDKIDSNQPGTLVVIDIDKFKNINDTFGHSTGDKVLISLARILQDNVQVVGNGDGPDLVARIGGEEFGIFLKNFSDPKLVEERVEKIRKAVEDSFVMVEGMQIKATISLGIVMRKPGESVESLMDRGDQVLYEAKHGGRNKYVISNDNV